MADFAAAGLCEILEVLFYVCGPTESVILLDEPALNLHPSKQRELYSALRRIAAAASNQLVIVTHSSSFVAPADLIQAFRFTKSADGTFVHRLQFADDKQRAQALKDAERYPRVLDALFAKGVILLEGYQEEAGLPIWFSKCEGGRALRENNILFLTVAGDRSFRRFVSVMDAWGIPVRLVGDGKARERIAEFADRAISYTEPDYPDLLLAAYKEQTQRIATELGGRNGAADPVVAMTLAIETDPPEQVKILWSKLKPFVNDPH